MANSASHAFGQAYDSSFANLPSEIRQMIILETISSTVEDLLRPGTMLRDMTPDRHRPVTAVIHALCHVCATVRVETLAVIRSYGEKLREDCNKLKLEVDEIARKGNALHDAYKNIVMVIACPVGIFIGDWATLEECHTLKESMQRWLDQETTYFTMASRLQYQKRSRGPLDEFLCNVAAVEEALDWVRQAGEYKVSMEEIK